MQKGTNIISSDTSYSNKVSEVRNTTFLFRFIFSFDNLYNSFLACCKGVRWKYSVQNYSLNACCRIARLQKRLFNKTYDLSKVKEFILNERGKTRKISALTFEDRIVMKCLCDNFLVALLSKSLVYDSGATIKRKGLSFTKKRVICHLQRFYRKHKNNGYALTIDFRHYFESINHNIMIDLIREKARDDDIIDLIKRVFVTTKDGLGLGSQVSQISAMYYLSELDHLFKEKFKIKYYERYADDILLISSSFNKLKHIKSILDKLVDNRELKINKSKTHIYELSKGFVFCKTRYRLLESGKILKLLVSNSYQSMKRKIKKGVDIANILPSFYSYMKDFNAYNKIKAINRLILTK